MKQVQIKLSGMVCDGCSSIIEKALYKKKGVEKVHADHLKNTVDVTYDPSVLTLQTLEETIRQSGYSVVSDTDLNLKSPWFQWFGIICLMALVFIISPSQIFSQGPLPDTLSLGALFIMGLLTSIHCIGMCGGIQLSVTLDTHYKKPWMPALSYNLGRVTGYTFVGGILGALGQAISITTGFKSGISIAAGIFIFLMGLQFLGLLKQLPLQLKYPKAITDLLNRLRNSNKNAYIVGVLNALIPCGPLQVVQLYALSTGSFFMGALSMFIFSLGTLPLMFAFGVLASLTGRNASATFRKVSGVLLILIAVVTLQRGLLLSGISIEIPTDFVAIEGTTPQEVSAVEKDGFQEVVITLTPGNYGDFTVKKGIPVRFIIEADENALTGCNQTVIIPEFDIEKKLIPGQNIIEFTPTQSGRIPYSCWMGMINNTITVVE